MSKLETNTIDTISGSTTLTLGGTNATTIAQDSATTVTGFKSTGIDDNATTTAVEIDSSNDLNMLSGNKFIANRSDNTRDISLYCDNDGGTLESSFDPVIFKIASSEKMRIASSGNVGIGTSSPTNALTVGGDINSNKLQLSSNAGSHTRLLLITDTGNAGSNRNFIEFHNNSGSTAGRIEHNGSTTVSYITSSDYRLKENVSYDFDATTRLKQLKPARFNFIEEPNKTVDGFLAHEVSSIVPEAISGEKDELQVWKEGEELPEGVSVGDNKLDKNGNTIMQIQGIDQAKLVPLLVKTIQELEARITQLENA